MTDNSEALLPCPFCGSSNVDPKGWASTDTSGPACDDCGASAGSTLKTNAENIAAWNTRPPAASDGDAVEYVARAIRRDRFVRTGRGAVVDESLPLTESELADARAALSALPPSPVSDGGAVLTRFAQHLGEYLRGLEDEVERSRLQPGLSRAITLTGSFANPSEPSPVSDGGAVREALEAAKAVLTGVNVTGRMRTDARRLVDEALASSPASSTDVEVLRQMTPAKAGAMVAAMGLRTQRACTPGEKLEARRDSEAVEALANALPAIRDALERERDAREIIRGLLSVIDEAANSEAGENAERQVIRAARQFVGSEQ